VTLAATAQDLRFTIAFMTDRSAKSPGQIVLVLQGGGALGAYQAGVYEAMHEAGLEPDWVIGISIGAINGAIIAGNRPEHRLPRLRTFWESVESDAPLEQQYWPGIGRMYANWNTVVRGIPAMFLPRPSAWGGVAAQVGLDNASYYIAEPLRATLAPLIDFRVVNAKDTTRLTVGAVNVTKGEMRYFDSRDELQGLGIDHVMASAALPPAFPAIRIGGEAYWDGGCYSNTPAEVVFDDNPRRDALMFAVNVWQPVGPEPGSIWEVMGRQKDIRYASRADSHIKRQKQIHKLRRIIRELSKHVTPAEREKAHVRELDSHGCNTTMHIVRLLAPTLDSEDFFKDIDFSAAGIRERWQAGLEDTRRMIAAAPWAGIVVHELSARTGG
jgi:NTE family protein